MAGRVVIPTACAGSAALVADAAAREATCSTCGRVVPVRTDRRLQRHNQPATAGKDT